MPEELDFQRIKTDLNSRLPYIVSELLPGGRLEGKEWTCGSVNGEKGKSLRFNIDKGVWADFATGDSGDIISLYSKINNVKPIEALKQLSDRYLGGNGNRSNSPLKTPIKTTSVPSPTNTIPPTEGTEPPNMDKFGGNLSNSWTYRDKSGNVMFYIARYDNPDGSKQYLPWCWTKQNKWVNKAWDGLRPLYNLPEIYKQSGKPILIVEGEKSADNASKIVNDKYVVISWANGANSWRKTDWKPVYGRNILIWPDADVPGRKVANDLSEHLKDFCPEVKVINVDDNNGWDAADAVSEGWDWDKFKTWAKQRVVSVKNPPAIEVVTVKTPPVETPHIVSMSQDGLILVDVDLKTESQTAIHEKLGIATTTSGSPIPNIDNCCRVFEGINDFNGSVWYDSFHQTILTTIPHGFTGKSANPRQWIDSDDILMTKFLQRVMGFQRITSSTVSQAVHCFAISDTRNEPYDYFESLEWDGVERIAGFLTKYMSAKDTEYIRCASRNFWIAMVARIYQPGCQVDNMLVLESKQGKGKTTAMRIIGGKWHTEALENVTSNNFFMALRGKLLVEIAELSSFPRQEILRVKQVISNPKDTFRKPYERATADHPRQNIFVATTNESKYLHDPTGGRRFWPVECGDFIDTVGIAENRGQLFAEAVARFKQGMAWYLMPVNETIEQQESRRQHDAWEQVVIQFLIGKHDVDMIDVANHLGIDKSKLDMNLQRRIGGILTQLGWQYSKGLWRVADIPVNPPEPDFKD